MFLKYCIALILLVYNSTRCVLLEDFFRLPAHRSHKRLDKIDGWLKTECYFYVCVDFFLSVINKKIYCLGRHSDDFETDLARPRKHYT